VAFPNCCYWYWESAFLLSRALGWRSCVSCSGTPLPAARDSGIAVPALLLGRPSWVRDRGWEERLVIAGIVSLLVVVGLAAVATYLALFRRI
jgi:hypothetical protein